MNSGLGKNGNAKPSLQHLRVRSATLSRSRSALNTCRGAQAWTCTTTPILKKMRCQLFALEKGCAEYPSRCRIRSRQLGARERANCLDLCKVKTRAFAAFVDILCEVLLRIMKQQATPKTPGPSSWTEDLLIQACNFPPECLTRHLQQQRPPRSKVYSQSVPTCCDSEDRNNGSPNRHRLRHPNRSSTTFIQNNARLTTEVSHACAFDLLFGNIKLGERSTILKAGKAGV
jgi:hypothetical protein